MNGDNIMEEELSFDEVRPDATSDSMQYYSKGNSARQKCINSL